MKISASYWIFEGGLEGELSISDAMEKTRKLGFDGIELGIASKGVLTHKTTKEECEEIRDLALSSQTKSDDKIETGHELLSNIANLVQYIPYTTNTFTTAAEALKQKKGVCQDQAHIMISSARFLGIPARYINGYMHNNMNSSEFQSTHAWAELYFQNLGWVGFDPTNRCSPDERYIRVSSGLDANYAAPIKGIIYGTSTEKLKIKVETQQINSQQ